MKRFFPTPVPEKTNLPKPCLGEHLNSNKLSPIQKTFSECYKKNINWMDDSEINVLDTLKSFYPEYYNGNVVQYDLLKSHIIGKITAKKANEFFKSLFKIPYVLDKSPTSDSLQTVISDFGTTIIAHGVEEAKGGMYNLLLMCVSNEVRSCSAHWGPLSDGPPNMSPVPHGPYYLIYNMPSASKDLSHPHNPKFSDIARILVPYKENRDILQEKLEAMVKVELISPDRRDSFLKRIISYDDFLIEIKQLGLSNNSGIVMGQETDKDLSDLTKLQ